jgi:predicted O-methyltransferase YrrM
MSSTFHLPQQVLDYVQRVGVREHPALSVCREETHRELGERAGMQISPEQGAVMQVLAWALRVRTAVEVGVFTGYSSTATALAMKAMHGDKAKLYACDISEDFTARARKAWKAAGVEDVIEARIGPAAQSLQALLDEGLDGKVDLAFIDADKTGYDAYYELVLKLLRPGGLLLIDNMLWDGKVADPKVTDADTSALRALAEKISRDERVEMTLATIGDGLSMVVKR